MKNLWSIPIVTVYVYAISTLSQYGFISYFYIPANYIEASISANIVLFYNFVLIALGVIDQFAWWVWLMLIIIPILGYGAYKIDKVSRIAVRCFLAAFVLFSLWSSVKFGEYVASHTTTFRTIPAECLGIGNDSMYVAVTFYGNNVLIAPVEKSNNKVNSTFFLRDLSELPCPVAYTTIGKVYR